MQEYWNSRFTEEGQIWGETPSRSADLALEIFKKYQVQSVFVPGAGYGRNTKLFSAHGMHTVGIEISEVAYNLAKVFDPQTDITLGSVFDLPLITEKYDAIYCFNVLHLFTEGNRQKVLNLCANILKTDGLLFFVVFSDQEASYGNGKKIEPHTYESKPGRPIHYYSERDLKAQFHDFSLLDNGVIEEKENHGSRGEHIHKLRYIAVKK